MPADRRFTYDVNIGGINVGSRFPIRVQSMTTAFTHDVKNTVAEIIRLHESGSEFVRVTVPTMDDASALKGIRDELKKAKVYVPLIADIHFNPAAALASADYVEKVRINPGNYADRKLFKIKDYTDIEYDRELEQVRSRFLPLIQKLKTNGAALRIGVNHGSLSDRVMNRYGDTPMGMVMSAIEFIEMAEAENYKQIVISMKSSIPSVMIEAYKVLVDELNRRQMHYPLHLGVTEAGDGKEARLKSAIGIASLLAFGIGDTIRVSLTEPPEHEIPVARAIVNTVQPSVTDEKETGSGLNSYFSLPDKVDEPEQKWFGEWPVFGIEIPETHKRQDIPLQEGIGFLLTQDNHTPIGIDLPVIRYSADSGTNSCHIIQHGNLKIAFSMDTGFLNIPVTQLMECHLIIIKATDEAVRSAVQTWLHYAETHKLQHIASVPCLHSRLTGDALFTSIGSNIGFFLAFRGIHGFIFNFPGLIPSQVTELATDLLQVTRIRMNRPDYIACPSCGRTLFDLEETTAKVKRATSHLKGLKIAVMGCIVNGPGEMADADFGYVGSGPGKISLYKGKEVVTRNIPSEEAVPKLIELIKSHGAWQEPS